MRILVVDDEPFVLKVLVRQLENLGYSEITPQQSAHAALRCLESAKGSIGLIFLDLQMPEMDGVEIVRHLAQVGYDGGLVLVSGEDERILQAAQKLAQAHKLDVLGALRKPVSPERLQEVLESNLLRTAATPRAHKSYTAEELANAIARGELVNYYQPQVELATGKLVGVETLVRWKHPQDGLVFPDQFISLAEEHGLIDPLTQAVLAAAMTQARIWRDTGMPLQLAVNISMDSLSSLEFPEFIVNEVGLSGLPAASLMLEVTESRLMKDPLAPLDILTRLRLKRIGLSIDDFGTGHSSLTQLRDLPFLELKIDRGFVHGACRDPSLRAIFKASLQLARQLGLKTVAEGVEDVADWEFLRSSGCDVAQGYLIGKPMPAAALTDWAEEWDLRRHELIPADALACAPAAVVRHGC